MNNILENKENKASKDIKNEDQVKYKKISSFSKNVEHYWCEWCKNTSLHGVRYLGERRRNPIEKLWWLIVLLIALSFCTFWITRTYNRWTTSPVIVNFADRPTSVWEISFPAVTVCPEIKISDKRIVRQLRTKMVHREYFTYQMWNAMNAIYLVCKKLFDGGHYLFIYGNNSIVDFIAKLAPEFKSIFLQCQWKNELFPCHDLFTPVLTEEGICYTFNSLDPEEIYTTIAYLYQFQYNTSKSNWNLEKDNSKDAGMESYPRRALSADATDGLTIFLAGNSAYDYDLADHCKEPGVGYKISLHRPDETPRMNSQYFKIGMNHEVTITVTPKIMRTSQDVKDFPVEKRKCYFSADRRLQFYKNYTQQKCDMECLANYTLEICKCVAFYMPRNDSTRICGAEMDKCMHHAQDNMISDKMLSALENPENNVTISCNCLPECTYLSYVAQTSQIEYRHLEYTRRFTSVKIFFKDSHFLPTQRNILYTIEDFLANCGGVLGLFIGFSFLSLAEIIYFLTVRFFCNLHQFGRHLWSGSPELFKEYNIDIEK